MRTPRIAVLACLVAVSATVAVAAPVVAAGSDIVIGVDAPLTGPQASNGVDMYRGVRLAVDRVNAAGGVNGRKVRIVRLDDQADPGLAAQMTSKAKAAGAFAVVGPYNSSVGVVNLPLYLKSRIVPVHLTSSNDTDGMGVTVQPKNDQIAPAEVAWAKANKATRIAMLVDPSTYTQGMADRFNSAMTAAGASVTSILIAEGLADYSAQVTQALSTGPDLVYLATYYPEGAKIAQALAQSNSTAKCLMTMSNTDPAMITEAGLAAAQRCVYSGEPTAAEQPGKAATAYVKAYRKAFKKQPGVWGIYTYDSANLLFDAIRAQGLSYAKVLKHLDHVTGYPGATGTITIDPKTGNRANVPVYIMRVDDKGDFVVE